MDPWQDAGWRSWLAQAWEFELRAFEAGVLMPRPLPTPSGACVADVESGDGLASVPVRLHAWVDAKPCPAGPVTQDVARSLGHDLARMHALRHLPSTVAAFPAAGRASVDGWAAQIQRLQERDGALAGAASEASEWVALIGQLFEAANTDFRSEPMGHGDVSQKNVLLSRAGPLLCDWDVAAPWAPRAELARTALSLARWERPEVARGTISAYRQAGEDLGPVVPQDLAVDLVIGLDWLCFCLERATGLRQVDEQRRRQSRRMVPSLLKRLPVQVDTALNIGTWLRGH
jgi:aminoglycoside phosphotransferase (APT) family kinase protein